MINKNTKMSLYYHKKQSEWIRVRTSILTVVRTTHLYYYDKNSLNVNFDISMHKIAILL